MMGLGVAAVEVFPQRCRDSAGKMRRSPRRAARRGFAARAEERRVWILEDDPKMVEFGTRKDLEVCGPGRAVLYGGFGGGGGGDGGAGVLRGVVAMADLGRQCRRHVITQGMMDGPGATVAAAVKVVMADGAPADDMDEVPGADAVNGNGGATSAAVFERPVVLFSGLDGQEIQQVLGGMAAAGLGGKVAYCMAVPHSVDRPLATVLGEVLEDFKASSAKPAREVQPDESKAAVLGPDGELLLLDEDE